MRTPSGFFPAFAHRNFRLFWVGQCVSLIGTWMQNVGQAWLVLKLTNSPLMLGIISAAQFLPVLLFSLFAGAVVDKYPKRSVIIFTQTGLMILAVALATLSGLGIIQYWQILIMSLLLGVVNTLDVPARQSYLVELVGKPDLMNAISLNSAVFNLTRIIGPAVAGILIGVVGISVCFYINAVSFVAVIIALLKIDPKAETERPQSIGPSGPNGPRAFSGIMASIREGLSYIVREKAILFPIILLGIQSTFVINFTVVVPTFASQELSGNALHFGLLLTSMGIGSFLAAIWLASQSALGPKPRVLLGGSLGMAVFFAACGFQHNFALTCVLLAICGFSTIAFTASSNSLIQTSSENAMRGRVMSVYALVFGGVTPIGSLYAGYISDRFGAGICMIVSGAIGIVATFAMGGAAYRYRARGLPGLAANGLHQETGAPEEDKSVP